VINPTAKDIDRKVVRVTGKYKARRLTDGRIIGFDDKWVYVTANPEAVCGMPFKREELEWFSGKDRT